MDVAVSRIAAAIGEPARARMLYALADGRARTSTELAMLAGVTPSTASGHLKKLTDEHLVNVVAQGKCRYFTLHGHHVAAALEALGVLAGRRRVVIRTPEYLRAARTCYDHIAGTLGVALHDRMHSMRWFHHNYEVTSAGAKALESLGIDVEAARESRRRFAFDCLDWSERRPHLGGALGAALLTIALQRKWVRQEVDSRALIVTQHGRREMAARFGLH